MTDGKISMRAFYCLTMPSTSEADIDAGLRYCRLFAAQDTMRELMKTDGPVKVDKEDVQMLFMAMDLDGDGRLTRDELVEHSQLSAEEVDAVMSKMDKDHSGELTKKEVEFLLLKLDHSLRCDLKASFGQTHSSFVLRS